MSQQDRGAYTPQTDAPLAFDARAPRGARRPLPMALIGSGVVLLVLIAAVVMYYRSGVRGAAPTTAAVGQPVTTVKTAPAAGAKDDDPFSNLDVYAAQNVPATAAKPTFTAPPEDPKARPAPGLKVQTIGDAPVHAAPAAAPAASTAVAAATPAPAAVKPVATTPATPAAPTAVAAATPAAATPATGGPASVQIGAYSSAELADKGYHEVATAFPTFMGGKTKKVEPLERDGKMLFRTSVSGFASHSSAQAFCAALKASGHVCLVKG